MKSKARPRPRASFGAAARLLVFGLFALSPEIAEAAAPDASPYHVVFTTAVACGNEAAFRLDLEWRTPKLRQARRGEPALTFRVAVRESAEGTLGQLEIEEPNGVRSTREVPAATCREALLAMALIAALSVDPFATSEAPPEPPSLPGTARTPSDGAPSAPARDDGTPAGLGVALGQRFFLQSALAPVVSYGLGVQAGLSLNQAAPFDPLIRVSGMLARSGTVSRELGSARFQWIAGRVALCPLRFPLASQIELRPCATLDLGSLEAAGFETEDPATTHVFWAAPGLEAGIEVGVVGPLRVGAEALVFTPFQRDRFYFVPDSPAATVHRIPRLGGSLAAGASVHFF